MNNVWNELKLCEIAEVVSGGTPSRDVANYWFPNTISWITPSDITKTTGNYINQSKECISKLGLASSSARMLPVGTLLFTSRATIGEMKISQIKACTNQGFKSLIVNHSYNNIFIYYLLSYYKSNFINLGMGSTFLEINKRDMDNFTLRIPDLPIQNKIAEILSTTDEVIEQTRALIEKYKSIKKGMLHDLFTRGIDPKTNKLRPTKEQAPELYHETKLGWIPKDWSAPKLSKICSTYAGGTPNRSNPIFFGGNIPWVSSGEVNQAKIIKTKENITKKGLEFSSAKLIPAGAILIAMYGATAGQISKLLIKATSNQAVLAIIPDKITNNDFVYFQLQHIKNKIIYLAQGSGQPNLNKGLIDNTLLRFPPLAEQILIAKRLEAIDKKIETEQSYLDKTQKIKQGLMQDLLTGNVPV